MVAQLRIVELILSPRLLAHFRPQESHQHYGSLKLQLVWRSLLIPLFKEPPAQS